MKLTSYVLIFFLLFGLFDCNEKIVHKATSDDVKIILFADYTVYYQGQQFNMTGVIQNNSDFEYSVLKLNTYLLFEDLSYNEPREVIRGFISHPGKSDYYYVEPHGYFEIKWEKRFTYYDLSKTENDKMKRKMNSGNYLKPGIYDFTAYIGYRPIECRSNPVRITILPLSEEDQKLFDLLMYIDTYSFTHLYDKNARTYIKHFLIPFILSVHLKALYLKKIFMIIISTILHLRIHL